ncbi:hypothetical protein JRO89_XS07G0262200 [Xanthoceras sorbifolium]|uniref:Uncharacterized protein n=1 Tax=Xanthoceras sorbifolium TaxID=99658 RepID=A0ABQ8HVF3_9ROSI|nr:hypothetical protein JRO89_XS07G0261900 [Xanthoceras sorbifolium]KAH7568215.1 hypothetical protein JRO89_XS07G0262200 [Xanthoceras sorbifolium]
MGRSPCCEKAHTNKGAWTKEEDQRLIDYIRLHGEGCWRSLPKAAGSDPVRVDPGMFFFVFQLGRVETAAASSTVPDICGDGGCVPVLATGFSEKRIV